jgi:hypothetical protein
MTPDRFDEFTRLLAEAPSRRAFLLQIGGVFLSGALARVGISVPWWASPDKQCGPTRDGMTCGGCGICQQGKCVTGPDDLCRLRGFGPGGPCRTCDPKTFTCKPCPKGQNCCTDGCCDGPCVDGACCPPAKLCGDQCCRNCAECRDGKCQKPEPVKSCPPNYVLVDGCCVCLPGLCGGVCCPEPEVCLGGKCCKYCGLDKAICCGDRVCCRERCQDAGKPCCPCREDISAEEGAGVVQRARETMQAVKDGGITYGQERSDPTKMDCTLFTARGLGDLHSDGDSLSSRMLDGNCNFRRLKPGEAPRAGDVVAQPRRSGDPGSQHVGIGLGTQTSGGLHLGIAMGNSGPSDRSVWGPKEGGGWFEGGDQLHVYRPQKPKKGCKE